MIHTSVVPTVYVLVVTVTGAVETISLGKVTNTLTVPLNVTALPELLDEKIVVRVSVGPVVE